VEIVRRQIQALGIIVYVAEHDKRPGVVLNDKLKAWIDRSRALIVLITPSSLDSMMVQNEIGYAAGKKVPFVPLVLKGTDTGEMGFLTGLEWNTLDPADPNTTMTDLTAGLQPLFVQQMRGFTLNVNTSDPATMFLLLGIGLFGGLYIASLLAEGG
jgi:hypothetical protein